MSELDVIVIGGGMRGMQAALRTKAERPEAQMLVVEAQAWPGDDVRTQRSNGFFCELGPFAFTREELAPQLEALPHPPRVTGCLDSSHTGWLFDGQERRPLRVEPEPCSFATGCEDLVQAYRRELDGNFRLGRAVTDVQPRESGGFTVTLGGEVPSELSAKELVLAMAPTRAARILGAFDQELPPIAEREQLEHRAFVWFGALSKDCPELHGYGVLPHPSLKSPLAELIFCTDVFPKRAMPDRCLVRAELAAGELPEGEDAIVRLAEEELRRWTGTKARFPFTKVHRFETIPSDGTTIECRTRLGELCQHVPGLSIAP